jgi:hypothetical protein
MNFTFSSPAYGTCLVKLWATGRYGFSLPKKVEITTPDGRCDVFLYLNKAFGPQGEPCNRTIVRIAIAQFLAGVAAPADGVPLDLARVPFPGELRPLRLDGPRAPLRVRPGKTHARGRRGLPG